jgi:hypothetical protein
MLSSFVLAVVLGQAPTMPPPPPVTIVPFGEPGFREPVRVRRVIRRRIFRPLQSPPRVVLSSAQCPSCVYGW